MKPKPNTKKQQQSSSKNEDKSKEIKFENTKQIDSEKQSNKFPSIPISVAMDLEIDKFKNKIDVLLNDFKVEAVSELLLSKREMIKNNQQFIDEETQKMKEEISHIQHAVLLKVGKNGNRFETYERKQPKNESEIA